MTPFENDENRGQGLTDAMFLDCVFFSWSFPIYILCYKSTHSFISFPCYEFNILIVLVKFFCWSLQFLLLRCRYSEMCEITTSSLSEEVLYFAVWSLSQSFWQHQTTNKWDCRCSCCFLVLLRWSDQRWFIIIIVILACYISYFLSLSQIAYHIADDNTRYSIE